MKRGTCLIATIALLVVLVVGAGPAGASPEPEQTTLSMEVQAPTKPQVPFYLVARLSGDGQRPITGQTVTFYREVTLLGGRDARLGSAQTDATGVAKLAFEPTQATGTIKATFAGTPELAPAETSRRITFPASEVSVAIPGQEVPLLEPVRDAMPRIFAGLVAVFWVLLLGLTVSTLRSIRRDGRSEVPSEG